MRFLVQLLRLMFETPDRRRRREQLEFLNKQSDFWWAQSMAAFSRYMEAFAADDVECMELARRQHALIIRRHDEVLHKARTLIGRTAVLR